MHSTSFPNKRIAISGVIALVIIAIGYMATNDVHISSLWKKQSQGTEEVAGNATSTITTRDTDKDMLPDWEEQLYGTNLNNPDTDGDGTMDGEEVELGRDPLVANSAKIGEPANDLAKTSLQFIVSSSTMSKEQKEFLTAYLTKAGKEIRETTYRDLLQTFDAEKFTPDAPRLTNLNIVSDNTNDGYREFINAFGAVVLKHKTAYAPRNEVDILNEFMQTKNARLLQELELCVIEYQNLIKDLRTLPVPSGSAKTLNTIIQGYEGMALGIQGLQKLNSDPMEAAGGYEGYTMYRVQVINGYAAIVNGVIERKMTFTEDEPGYMFYANVLAQRSK